MNRFSIVIPAFNSIKTLPAAVGSALAQEFGDFQVIVSDNASDDGSVEYLKSLKNPRLTVLLHPERVSKTRNWNRAFLGAPLCEYYVNLHSDDILLPSTLRVIDDQLRKNDNVVLVHGQHHLLSLNGSTITKQYGWPVSYCTSGNSFIKLQSIENASSIVGITFRAADFKKIGGFPVRFDFLQDVAMFSELAKRGNVVYSSSHFGYYRAAPIRKQNLIQYYCECIEWAHESRTQLPTLLGEILFKRRLLDIQNAMALNAEEGMATLDACFTKLKINPSKNFFQVPKVSRTAIHRLYRAWIAVK